MAWTWDRRKAAQNLRKHGVAFEDGLLVFADPLCMTRPDPYPDEERY